MELLICIGCSVVASIVTTKILATHYFKIVDGYVDDVCNKTKEFINELLEIVKRESAGQIKECVLSPDELPQHSFRV